MTLYPSIRNRIKWLFNPRFTVELHCAYCGSKFSWTGKVGDPQPSYCKPGHRNKSREARKKRQEAFELSQPREAPTGVKAVPHAPLTCPTPDKRRYTDLVDAMRHVARVDSTMKPYICRCGVIHVGHGRNL